MYFFQPTIRRLSIDRKAKGRLPAMATSGGACLPVGERYVAFKYSRTPCAGERERNRPFRERSYTVPCLTERAQSVLKAAGDVVNDVAAVENAEQLRAATRDLPRSRP